MDRIIDAFNAFEQIESSNSRLWKLNVLSKNATNSVFQSLLKACYNQFLIYNIKKFDVPYDRTPGDPIVNYGNFGKLLSHLHNRVYTGNAALNEIYRVFSTMNDLEVKWYSRVLKKDLDIGIQAKTINEAIPGLIPVFGVMLAQPFRSYPETFVLQPKFDGMRILGDTTTGKLYSRKGKLVEGFNDIEEELQKLPSGFFIDGEILAGAKGEKIQSFNKLMTQAFRKSSGKQGLLFAFDLVPIGVLKGMDSAPWITREEHLILIFQDIPLNFIKKVDSSPAITAEHSDVATFVDNHYANRLREGFEGLIIKDINAPYELKRSYSWQKVKPTETYDLKVIGIEEGNEGTKYVDQVGRLVCDFNGEEVRVGSGLTDDQRLDWWLNPDKIMGKTVEIMAQEQTSNKRGTKSLRFPRLKRIREDK